MAGGTKGRDAFLEVSTQMPILFLHRRDAALSAETIGVLASELF
jgi:hypothetical protein